MAVALLVAAAVVLLDGGGGDGSTEPAAVTTTEVPSTTATTATPTTAAPDVDRAVALWPVAGTSRYDEPRETASAFASDFLGFRLPVVGEYQAGDSRSGEVEIRPTATGPVTTVLVRQLEDGAWYALGSASPGIVLEAPSALAEIRSPVTLSGGALAFEGHVQVEVREDGAAVPIGTGYVTGGGDVARPFTGSVAFEAPTGEYGSIVLLTQSAEDGRVWQAVATRVRFARGDTVVPAGCDTFTGPPPAAGAGEMVVTTYATCGAEGSLVPLHRLVPRTPGVLRAAMTALLAGPTDEEVQLGVQSWFSSSTAGLLRGVDLDGGHAVVDFGDLRQVIPNASSSAGSASLLASLDATVFQFPTVATAEYRIDGSCEAFTEWLQVGGCEPRSRP